MNKGYFEGKAAIVTGGASGIGKAICEKLAELDCAVGILDLDDENAKNVAHLIKAMGGRAIAIKADVSSKEQMEQAVDIVHQRFGRLDFIFNNAGAAIVSEMDGIAPAVFDKIVGVNLLGTAYGTLFAYRKMIEQGSGHIVNIASIAGILPGRFATAYSASKFGIVGMTLSLRMECKKHGVTASVVCPSAILTPMFGLKGAGEVDQALFERNVKYIRFMSPEKCASQIMARVARRRMVIPLGFLSYSAWLLWRLSPRLFEGVQNLVYRLSYDNPRKKLAEEMGEGRLDEAYEDEYEDVYTDTYDEEPDQDYPRDYRG
jgi:NAD(P)-dependent dehydrogenase (short-subunit alcohol dehydrogenase family)